MTDGIAGGGAKYRRLANSLIADIRAGRWATGEKLPTIRELSADHGWTTARDAMRVLQAEGYIVTAGAAGTYIADPLPNGEPEDAPNVRIANLAAELAEVREAGATTQARVDQLEDQLRTLHDQLGIPRPGVDRSKQRRASRSAG